MFGEARRHQTHIFWDFESINPARCAQTTAHLYRKINEFLKERRVTTGSVHGKAFLLSSTSPQIVKQLDDIQVSVVQGNSVIHLQHEMAQALNTIKDTHNPTDVAVVVVSREKCFVRDVKNLTDDGFEVYVMHDVNAKDSPQLADTIELYATKAFYLKDFCETMPRGTSTPPLISNQSPVPTSIPPTVQVPGHTLPAQQQPPHGTHLMVEGRRVALEELIKNDAVVSYLRATASGMLPPQQLRLCQNMLPHSIPDCPFAHFALMPPPPPPSYNATLQHLTKSPAAAPVAASAGTSPLVFPAPQRVEPPRTAVLPQAVQQINSVPTSKLTAIHASCWGDSEPHRSADETMEALFSKISSERRAQPDIPPAVDMPMFRDTIALLSSTIVELDETKVKVEDPIELIQVLPKQAEVKITPKPTVAEVLPVVPPPEKIQPAPQPVPGPWIRAAEKKSNLPPTVPSQAELPSLDDLPTLSQQKAAIPQQSQQALAKATFASIVAPKKEGTSASLPSSPSSPAGKKSAASVLTAAKPTPKKAPPPRPRELNIDGHMIPIEQLVSNKFLENCFRDGATAGRFCTEARPHSIMDCVFAHRDKYPLLQGGEIEGKYLLPNKALDNLRGNSAYKGNFCTSPKPHDPSKCTYLHRKQQ